MEVLIYILIYVLGCVLTYGRLNAQNLEYEEMCGMKFPFHFTDWILMSLSWLMFIGGVVCYFTEGDKYFFKF